MKAGFLVEKMKNIGLKSQKSRFNRMCIGETLIELLKEKDFKKIKISHVVKKAGVSRTTFYKHYDTLEEVLYDYMNEIVADYTIQRKDSFKMNSLYDYETILFTFQFFDHYSDFFQIIAKNNMYSILIDAINRFMTRYFYSDKYNLYELYCYSGGILNIFIKWEEQNKDAAPEEIAQIVYNVYHHLQN